jgi:hypothetical protein
MSIGVDNRLYSIHKSLRKPFVRGAFDIHSSKGPGIYIFWNGDTCIYVGSTDRTIAERLCEHWTKSHNDELGTWIKALGSQLKVSWEVVDVDSFSTSKDKTNRIRWREQIFIDSFKPLTNKVMARSS